MAVVNYNFSNNEQFLYSKSSEQSKILKSCYWNLSHDVKGIIFSFLHYTNDARNKKFYLPSRIWHCDVDKLTALMNPVIFQPYTTLLNLFLSDNSFCYICGNINKLTVFNYNDILDKCAYSYKYYIQIILYATKLISIHNLLICAGCKTKFMPKTAFYYKLIRRIDNFNAGPCWICNLQVHHNCCCRKPMDIDYINNNKDDIFVINHLQFIKAQKAEKKVLNWFENNKNLIY